MVYQAWINHFLYGSSLSYFPSGCSYSNKIVLKKIFISFVRRFRLFYRKKSEVLIVASAFHDLYCDVSKHRADCWEKCPGNCFNLSGYSHNFCHNKAIITKLSFEKPFISTGRLYLIFYRKYSKCLLWLTSFMHERKVMMYRRIVLSAGRSNQGTKWAMRQQKFIYFLLNRSGPTSIEVYFFVNFNCHCHLQVHCSISVGQCNYLRSPELQFA